MSAALAESFHLITPFDIVCSRADPRKFNMLFETSVGAVDGGSARAFLRPETAQGVYTQWRNVHTVTRNRLPIGVASLGRSFRNEISTSNYIFRTREFEQAELQYFCDPAHSQQAQKDWVQFCFDWLLKLGIRPSHLRLREHSGTELAHYALATTDIEYLYPFGWGELWYGQAFLASPSIAQSFSLQGGFKPRKLRS